MFWDTTDYWMDDYQTKKVKAYRRKSNYYESKNDDLQQLADTISGLLSQAESDYGFENRRIQTISDNVLEYSYKEAEFVMYQIAQEVIEGLKYDLAIVYQEKDVAYSLYCNYYNLALQEDY